MRFTKPKGDDNLHARLRLRPRLRPRLRLRLASLLLLMFAGAGDASAQDITTAAPRRALADMIVVSDSTGVVVYAADAASGEILFYRPASESVGSRTGYDAFKPLYKSATYRSPSALAYADGKLIVADARSSAVYELTLDTMEERLLLQENKATPGAPVGVAASSHGRLAVGYSGYLSAVIYDGREASPSIVAAAGPVSNPARLAFGSNSLMILNRESGVLYEVPVASPTPSQPAGQAAQQTAQQVVQQTAEPSNILQQASPLTLPTQLFDSAGAVKDFAVHDGVVYFAGARGLSAIRREDLARQPGLGQRVFIDHTTREISVDRVAVAENYLVASDDESESLWVRTRPSSVSHLQAAGEHLFWLDSVSKKIYRAPRVGHAQANAQQTTAGGGHEVVWDGAPLRDPVALAADLAGNVYVLDQSGPAVYVMRSGGRRLQPVRVGAPLQRPNSIAAFGDWLYISDAEAKAIFSLNLARGEIIKEYSERLPVFPDRLIYAGGNLVAVNTARKILYRFVVREDEHAGDADDKAPAKTAAEAGAKTVLKTAARTGIHRTLFRAEEVDFSDAIREVTDVALSDFVLYFLDTTTGRVALLPLREGDSVSFSYEYLAHNPRRIAADFSGVYLASADGRAITPLPPVEPATLYFEGDWTAQALVDFYNYLHKHSLLPRKLARARGARPLHLEAFAEQTGVMPTGYVDDFQQLFCQMNPALCNERQSRPPRARSRGERFAFPVVIRPGRDVWLPDLNVTSYTARRGVKLPVDVTLYRLDAFRRHAGGTLGELAKEFVAPATSDAELAELLRDINPSYKGEDIMAERSGYFVIPILSARVQAAVLKRDITDPTSELSEIAQRNNVLASTMSRPAATKTSAAPPARASSVAPGPRLSALALNTPPVTDERCEPIDTALLSPAMRLTHYCLPKEVLTKPVMVGVIDNIFDRNHEAFRNPDDPTQSVIVMPSAGNVRRTTDDAEKRPPGEVKFIDRLDHGTHIAGLIAARKQSRRLMGFSPTATVYAMNTSNFITASSEWTRLKLFNISLGETRKNEARAPDSTPKPVTDTSALKSHVENTPLLSALFIIAAGNDGEEITSRDALAATGAQENVIVVGATDMSDPPERMKESNTHGKLVGVMAPGGPVTSALYGGGYGDSAGTSQATAIVTGTAAILKALKREWQPWKIKFRIVSTADLWTKRDKRNLVLSGVLNVERAVLDTDHAVVKLARGDTCRGTLSAETLTRDLVIRRGAERIKIPFDSILRIARQEDLSDNLIKYTIIYFETPPEDEWGKVRRGIHRLSDIEPNMVIDQRTFTFEDTDPNTTCKRETVELVDLLDFVNRFEVDP
ncbi:MAG TPA: S8 family serine peptidase [Pyrinomonadaceae bacterium]|nr:S8 family serine peptidase [Pyrinomonadaceae bacterium]